MKLVIDIPEGHYNSIFSGHDIEIYYGEHFVTKDSWASELIRKGTPLEQEPILDKLRAEITTLQNRCYALTKGAVCRFCKYECEHKAESEIEDGND